MPVSRLAGGALMASFALVVAIAMAKVGSCDYDCGDRGGRGASWACWPPPRWR
jgi:hypothetical protein